MKVDILDVELLSLTPHRAKSCAPAPLHTACPAFTRYTQRYKPTRTTQAVLAAVQLGILTSQLLSEKLGTKNRKD